MDPVEDPVPVHDRLHVPVPCLLGQPDGQIMDVPIHCLEPRHVLTENGGDGRAFFRRNLRVIGHNLGGRGDAVMAFDPEAVAHAVHVALKPQHYAEQVG